MTLYIYNSLTRTKEPFAPIERGHVRMYVCGVTVYEMCHLGHARMMISFDVVQRWLRAKGWKVTYVRNITDVDDKIIRKAVNEGVSVATITERYIKAMHEDLDALGIERPTHEPRATDYIPQMLGIIGKLETHGLAYRTDGGDVNFSVRRFAGYGKLSGKTLDDLRAGERVAVNDDKQDPLDFVLWKAAKPQEPSDVTWDSPFGPGRPGWHIECSAMSCELLGQPFDIHGGGQDLQFPHHENEIAQSEAAYQKPLAMKWMHNGFVRINEEKMSKSLGNVFLIRTALEQFDAETLRFFLLRAHYRSPINLSEDELRSCHQSLTRLYNALHAVPPTPGHTIDWQRYEPAHFAQALDDDFNTPEAVAMLFDLANQVQRDKDPQQSAVLQQLGGILGLLQQDPAKFMQKTQGLALTPEQIEQQIELRLAAKRDRNFALADQIRAQLLELGVVVEDSAKGSTWRRA